MTKQVVSFALATFITFALSCNKSEVQTTENQQNVQADEKETSNKTKVNKGRRPKYPVDSVVSIISWNVDGGGSDKAEISKRLKRQLKNGFEIFVLQEVSPSDAKHFANVLGDDFDYVLSGFGKDTRLMTAYMKNRFKILDRKRFENGVFANLRGPNNDGVAPLAIKLCESNYDWEFWLFNVRLSYQDADLRLKQAKALRKWTEESKETETTVFIGGFGFEYNFREGKGNKIIRRICLLRRCPLGEANSSN